MSMLMDILAIVVMLVLVTTMGRGRDARGRSSVGPKKQGDRLVLGRGVKVGPPQRDPRSGVVTYRLLDDRKLPTRTQRAWRRVSRPLSRMSGWLRGTKRPEVGPVPTAGRPASGKSVELQNFLEARNREIAQRKSADPSKRGPEDTLH